MQKLFCSCLFMLLGSVMSHAQLNTDFVYKQYTWTANPQIHKVNEQDGNYIILKDKVIIEFAYESSGQLIEFRTRHTIIHFNNEKGIEEMNKVYVPSGDILEEMDLKGRTITSDGKIIPLSKSSVKKVDNIGNSGPYLIFAMEGIDKGGEIEYMYTNKKTASNNLAWTIQSDIIKKDVSVDIYSPKNLIYEAKGYNGFSSFTIDTTIENKNHIYAVMPQISAIVDEKYSMTDAHKMRFEYQLTYNTSKGNARLYSWEYCGNDMYNAIFNTEKSEIKAVEKLISKLGLNDLKSDEKKIQGLEQYMKTNISITQDYLPIDKILEGKYGSRQGIQRLYIAAAKAMNIPCELVLTGDRTERKFDSDFASWNSLTDYLLYFPSMDKYLSGANYLSRLGFPPPENTNTKGLFVKETTLGDIKTGIAKIKTIQPLEYASSYNNLNEKVVFDESFVPLVNIRQEYAGYPAYYLQPSVLYMDENQIKEMKENLSKFVGKETVVKSTKFIGIEKQDILINPFIVESELELPQLVENGGNKFLFKVGALIGPQAELYQEKERQTDGEIMYNHSFTRNIEIKIPEGHKVKNLDDIKIEKHYTVNGKDLSSFVSSYTLEQNVIKITVYEDYRSIIYPKADYEQFRQVINAAADFNKVVLIFEKL